MLPKLSSYKPPLARTVESFSYLKGLQLADPSYLIHTPIELLLGADVYTYIIEDKIVRGSAHQPMAMSSKFGWLLSSRCSENNLDISTQMINLSAHNCTTIECTVSYLDCQRQVFFVFDLI